MTTTDTHPYSECDPFERYAIYSTETGAEDDITQWCKTNSLSKAEAVFDILKTHRERLGIKFVALMDEDTRTAIKSDGGP